MTSAIVFRECPARIREGARDYWQSKTGRMERLLAHMPPDQAHLRLSLKQHGIGFDARAVLALPTGTLVASSRTTSTGYMSAIDDVVDRLTHEIRRHKELLRYEHVQRRRRRRAAEAALAADRHLERGADRLDRQAFQELLRPVLQNLRDHAHHELVLARLEGVLRPGELTLSELFDELITRAWDHFGRRPRSQSLEAWLVHLLHEMIDERAREPAPEHIDGAIAADDRRYEADDAWVVENEPYWGEPQGPTLDDVLPAGVEPWQRLAAAERRRWILTQLRTLPKLQRRAFALHVLEGWDVEDVAMLQRRPAAAVREDVESARAILRARMAAAST